jgi:hypothetical protein
MIPGARSFPKFVKVRAAMDHELRKAGTGVATFWKWLGPLALLAVLVIGDQIRINRPGHKYRLTVEVETPTGVKSASGVLAITPDRGYSNRGKTRTSGEAVLVDLGAGKNLVALLAHPDKAIDLDGINYVALRAYGEAGVQRVSFNQMSRMTGVVPVTGALIPLLAAFADPADPATMRSVAPDNLAARLGPGYRLHRVTAEVVPNGFWPVDFGGPLGEPVTRGIQARLPWLDRAGAAAVALKAAGLASAEPIDASEAFTRK